MGVLFWVLVVMFSLGILGGAYFISCGGYHSSRSDRLFSIVLSGGLAIWLGVFTSDLTWFGWALFAMFVYDTLIALYHLATKPNGKWVGTGWCTASLIVGILAFVGLFTVGITA